MGAIPHTKQWLAIGMAACWMAAALPSSTYAEPAQQGEGGEAEELPVAPGYMPMPMLNIAVVKNGRVSGHLMVEMVLDAASDEVMQAIAGNRTLLSANYTKALGIWAAAFQDARAVANVIAIKNQLQNETDKVLGRTDAIVLLQSAMLRR